MDLSGPNPPTQPFTTPGTLHSIKPNLLAFEPTKPLAPSPALNTLLWIGGLSDTLLSVHYPLALCQTLPPTWSVLLASLPSAGTGWGVSTLHRDADDLSTLTTYLRTLRPQGKIIMMGHSTGCQDCIEYLTGRGKEGRPGVEGVILQAPVSDREALANELPEAFKREAVDLAREWTRSGKEKDCLPNRLTRPVFGRVGITARRWLDLSTSDGADDFFSSDLPDSRLESTFGALPPSAPLLILYGGADESVPESVDKRRLVQRWMHATEKGGGVVDAVNGGVVEGASHNLNGQGVEVVGELVRRVVGYLERLERGELRAGGARM